MKGGGQLKSNNSEKDSGQLKSNNPEREAQDMLERVQKAGGQLADSNIITFTLTWNAKVDLDIHCELPNGKQCCYNHKKPTDYIKLDVDLTASHVGKQVENIVLRTDKCIDGLYKFFVRYYSGKINGRPCDFQFLLNEKGQKLSKGSGVSPKPKVDTPVVDVAIKNGQVAYTEFH